MDKLERFNLPKFIRVLLLICCDIVLINLAQFLALLIRFEFSMRLLRASGFLEVIMNAAPWYTLMTVGIFFLFGIYNSLWQYVSVEEAMLICDKIVAAQDKIRSLEAQIDQIKAESEARKAEREAEKAERKAAEKAAEAEQAAEKAGIEKDPVPVCADCGAVLAEGQKFCGSCGKPVGQ